MSRRFLAVVAVLAAVAIGGVFFYTADGGEEGPPNILIVVTDDQRARGTLDVMPEVRRWFVDAGTSFTDAFTTTPLCCPARASIFSGRYVHNHGVKHNYKSEVLDQDATLQAWLKDAGYQTGIAGKFLNHWPCDQPVSRNRKVRQKIESARLWASRT